MVIGVIGCRALTYINNYKPQVRPKGSEHVHANVRANVHDKVHANDRTNTHTNVRANVQPPDGDPENLISGPTFKSKHSHNLAGSSVRPERGSHKCTPLMCPPELSFFI